MNLNMVSWSHFLPYAVTAERMLYLEMDGEEVGVYLCGGWLPIGSAPHYPSTPYHTMDFTLQSSRWEKKKWDKTSTFLLRVTTIATSSLPVYLIPDHPCD